MSDADLFIKLLPEILDDPAAAKVYDPVVCCGSPAALSSAAKWLGSVIARRLPDAEIVRIDGDVFINRLIQTIKESGDITRFTKSWCSGTVLILTGLEAFSRKEMSGEILYHILDAYLLRGQPIVVFTGTPPSRIPKLMPRIRAQLEGGILLDLGNDPIGNINS